MPVVTPARASTVSQKAVPKFEVLAAVISGMRSASSRSSVSAAQIRPRPCRAMKLIAAGVIVSAAMVRSPSFSRSASSTTMTMRPARMSAMASSIVANGVVATVALTPPFYRALRCPAGNRSPASEQDCALPRLNAFGRDLRPNAVPAVERALGRAQRGQEGRVGGRLRRAIHVARALVIVVKPGREQLVRPEDFGRGREQLANLVVEVPHRAQARQQLFDAAPVNEVGPCAVEVVHTAELAPARHGELAGEAQGREAPR